MYPEHRLDELHVKVLRDNGDGTETEMTASEFEQDCLRECLVEVDVGEHIKET